MSRKIPDGAFECYVGMGTARSYSKVAMHLRCSKKGITNLAKREDWQSRLRILEEQAREKSDAMLVEELIAMRERHIKAAQFLFGKAIEGLRSTPMNTPASVIRALDVAIRHERQARGISKKDIDEVERLVVIE